MQENEQLQLKVKVSKAYAMKKVFRGMHFLYKHLGAMTGTKCLDPDSHTEQDIWRKNIQLDHCLCS